MPQKLKLLVIHCTATPAGRVVTGDDIRRWHLSPEPSGRGWKQVGYRDLILLDGRIENLTPYDQDDEVDPWEITNGASGYNSIAHHICYVGGCTAMMKPADTRTPEQRDTLINYIRHMVDRYPDIRVAGHTQLDPGKACPSFDVPAFCRAIDIPEENIYKPDF